MRKESDTPPKRRRFALGPSPNHLRVKSTREGGIVGLYRTVLASRYSRTQALPFPLSGSEFQRGAALARCLTPSLARALARNVHARATCRTALTAQRAAPAASMLSDWWAPRPPAEMTDRTDATQCGYEMLRAFAGYASSQHLRFTLGAGTLLGAMRNRPSGLLKWEHDVDVYMLASEASALLHRLERDCPADGRHRRSRWCTTLHLRGLVDRDGSTCCGFGYKLFHRRSDACELDVLVLGAADAPYMHGETPLWPPWGPLLAAPWNALAAAWLRGSATAKHKAAVEDAAYYVIPEDVWRKSLMADDDRWCDRAMSGGWRWCGGPPISFFHAEYFAPGDLFPLRSIRLHGLRLPIPNRPWAILNRTYGHDCAYIARLNEHRDAVADLRMAEHAHLAKPARIRRRAWWQG